MPKKGQKAKPTQCRRSYDKAIIRAWSIGGGPVKVTHATREEIEREIEERWGDKLRRRRL